MTAATLPADLFAALNDEQRGAVAHGSGPLLVIAGAGTGKTMTLAARVARLVLDGADPNRLLLLTFSRRAAQELAHRAGRLLHAALGFRATQAAPTLPWAGTFHAVGARLLREHAASIGLSPQFTLLDRGDAEDLMGIVRQQLELGSGGQRFPLKGTCLAIYSRVVNAQLGVDAVVQQVFPWCRGHEPALKQLFAAYIDAKQQQQVLDYDDLLLYWQQMLEEPALAHAIGARFEQVLVDEYQDTNRLQSAILKALKPDGRGLTVVGDDAQSIYSFRAADVRNILDFPAQFEPSAEVVTLTHNYRSTQAILAASNAVIALATERHPKDLHSPREGPRPRLVSVADEMAQARGVADEVLLLREGGLALKRQAVLFRTGHHSAALELELTRRGIPFVKFGGLRFLEAAHVKDLLSVLRWVQNPRGRLAGYRVVQMIPGLGAASARRLLDAIAAADDPLQALHTFKPPAAAAADWRGWLAAHEALREAGWPAAIAQARRWYEPHLERLHEDATIRRADLAQLERLAAQYPSRERFLAELTLDPPEATSDAADEPHRDEDYLILSTLHSAKGQEWSAVHILNAVDGCMPADLATGHADEIEEERRLLYVGMTRAKHHLTLWVPQRFHITQQSAGGDRHLYGSLTRFIPEDLAQRHFDRVVPASTLAAETAGAALPSIDLMARVRRAF
ncbi:ATP-dependent helicase [Variovorax sp. YR752]|uniref:ATP-dependent helicase n=1 Tax=Variovorax sp. YR752 TaxID=1884383 RepID=UPI003137D9C5